MKDETTGTGRGAGARIRELRLLTGIRQTDLARQAGISPSYLNLIEHDRRPIGGHLLLELARALDVAPARISDGAAPDLVATLVDAARGAERPDMIGEADVLATAQPGWAAVIAAQRDRVAALENEIAALRDRLRHDTALAASLHDMISTATAIRSTAAILIGEEHLDAHWLQRFHKNLHDDAVRLAASSSVLMAKLDPARADRADAL